MAEAGHPGTALPPLREVIREYGLSARKGLGQHFLLDSNLTRKIARAGGPVADTRIYEVGPGPGGLTRMLLEEGAAEVVAVEKDSRCVAALGELAGHYPGRLRLVEDDALKCDETTFFPNTMPSSGPRPRIVANLPYNVGTALLVKWLTVEPWPPWWQSATLMFQKEVAERIVAAPGTAHYGRLAVLAGWRCRARRLFDVPALAFTPPPKVTSAVVRLEPSEPCVPGLSVAALERLTRAAFGRRRKMLRSALKPLGPEVPGALEALGIAPTARAEELSVEQFCRLALALSKD